MEGIPPVASPSLGGPRREYMEGVVIHQSDVMGTLGKLKPARFHCVSCSRNLTMETRIRCVECVPTSPSDSYVDLCLGCFCAGKEPAAHSKFHKYQVFSNLHFALFSAKWSAEEEMLLLEGLTLYGFGNWADVGDHVGTKNEDECFEHYMATYAQCTDSFPMPMNLDAATAVALQQRNQGPIIRVQDYVGKHKKVLKKAQASNPIKPDLGGYMPNRGEFEFPFNDQAEVAVQQIKFSATDTPEERKIKMDALQVYHSMLEERAERSTFAVNNKLLKWKSQQKVHRSLSDDADRKLLTKLRPFLQVMQKEKWEQFADGMIREASLRRAIDYYCELRKEGVRTERDAEDYQLRARKRGKYSSRRDAPFGPPPVFESLSSVVSQQQGLRSARSAAALQNLGAGRIPEPGSELLGDAEKTLAWEWDLTPTQYLIIKEAMVRESCRAGGVTRKEAKTLAPFEAEKLLAVWEFLNAGGVLLQAAASQQQKGVGGGKVSE